MANVKISEMTPDGSVGGSELLPVSDAGSPKSVTVDNIKDYIVDAIEAISAAESVSGSDGIFVLQGGVLKPADIDLVAQHAIDTIWGKDAEASPDSADILALKDGGTTEKTVTLALLAEYVRATIEAAILDISDLSDGSGALTGTDKMLVTQGTTGKYVTLTNVSNAIYAALKTYVAALGAVTTSLTDDVFYCIQGGTEKKVTLAEIATYIGALYTVPSETTANGIPQWTNATGGLKNGLTLVTAVGAEGDDSSVPSEQAVRESMSTLVYDQADIGEALADDDTIVVDDGAAGTTQRKSALSRVWTYIVTKLQAISEKATPVVADILLIADTEDSNDLKKLTITNLATVVNGLLSRDMTPGTGISTGDETICEHTVRIMGGIIKTEILVDLTGLNDGDTAADVIGKDEDTANCYLGQITAAVNGSIIAGRITCFETPAGGTVDVDLWTANEGTLAQDTAISAATGEAQLCDHGNWAAEEVDFLTAFPPDEDYLYLVTGAQGTDADYTAGIFLIELWGV